MPLHGALVIEETFDYEAGGLSGENGGTGFSAAWNNTRGGPTVALPGLTAGDLASAGGTSRGAAWSGMERTIGTSLSGAGLMANGTSLWFSAIFDLTASNIANADISLALGTDQFVGGDFGTRENLASGEGIGITHSRGVIQAVSWTGGGVRTESPNSTLTLNTAGNPTSALIVGRIDWGADDVTGETVTLWAPAPDLTLGTEILATWTTDALTQSAFDQISIQYKDSPQVDEIRFGSTSTDVLPVPEPSSAVLLGLASLALAARRRR